MVRINDVVKAGISEKNNSTQSSIKWGPNTDKKKHCLTFFCPRLYVGTCELNEI
jgi:hypothetical protein